MFRHTRKGGWRLRGVPEELLLISALDYLTE